MDLNPPVLLTPLTHHQYFCSFHSHHSYSVIPWILEMRERGEEHSEQHSNPRLVIEKSKSKSNSKSNSKSKNKSQTSRSKHYYTVRADRCIDQQDAAT